MATLEKQVSQYNVWILLLFRGSHGDNSIAVPEISWNQAFGRGYMHFEDSDSLLPLCVCFGGASQNFVILKNK
jgi:hypothetical protein